jgi:hypothetical protein
MSVVYLLSTPREITMTYNELLTEIRRVNCDPLLGAGKFSKEELLADRICALMNEKTKPKGQTLFLDARAELGVPEKA